MGYTQFLAWVGKQGLKIPGLQKYLYKAWKEAEKVGAPIVEKNFPHLLTKAKDFYKNFKTFDPKVVKPKLQLEKSKQIIEGMKPKEGIVNLGDRIIKKMQREGKNVTFDDIIRIYGPKKPPGKQEGGRIGFDEGGGIEEVWDKPSIDKARKSLEESKPKLMEESYNLLINFLNRKQEELDIGIMKSAGGLGDLLGEGGRADFQDGNLIRTPN